MNLSFVSLRELSRRDKGTQTLPYYLSPYGRSAVGMSYHAFILNLIEQTINSLAVFFSRIYFEIHLWNPS